MSVTNLDLNGLAQEGVNSTTTFVEGSGPVFLFSTATVQSDGGGDGRVDLVKLQLDGWSNTETLSLTAEGMTKAAELGVAVTYNSQTGTLALSKWATISPAQADWNFLLRNIQYNNTGDAPVDRLVTVTATDNTGVITTSKSAIDAIDALGVNDAPSGTDKTITINEDAAYAFAPANFGFSDTDGNALMAVRIATLPEPAAGTLELNGVPVTAGQEIANSAIRSLVFQPASDANGTGLGSFTFQVKDNGGVARGGTNLDPTPNTITFNVNAVNDAPALTGMQATLAAGSEDVAYTVNAAQLLQGYTDVDGTASRSPISPPRPGPLPTTAMAPTPSRRLPTSTAPSPSATP